MTTAGGTTLGGPAATAPVEVHDERGPGRGWAGSDPLGEALVRGADRGRPARDVYDTSRCPLGVRCESCGTEHGHLRVCTVGTPLGVLCLTQCPACAGSEVVPVTMSTAQRFVGHHAEHVGLQERP